MQDPGKKIVKVGPRLSKFIGAKATPENKMKAASMQAEFTLRDTLVILCYLSRDENQEISQQARKNLIPAARNWYARPDRPELPEPIHEIVLKVIDKIGAGAAKKEGGDQAIEVVGNIGLFGLGEMIQTVDHNNRTVTITLTGDGLTGQVYTDKGKVVGAVTGNEDGLEALYQAFGWVDYHFTYTHEAPGPFENKIQVNTLNLVMDALERAPDDDPFDSEASVTWTVAGKLSVMNIFEIAEIFEMNSKQCVCKLTREGKEGNLYFNNGRVVNAALDEMTGLDAACHLLAWPHAQFLVQRGGEEVSEEIHVGMQNLIIEAMRLVDEGVTVSDQIASELAVINDLFEGKDLISLPILDKVRIVFGEDQEKREALEVDTHPLVRKALKVKISKTVYKYLKSTTDHDIRLLAAQGRVPLSTAEKLVLLSYLSRDESQDIRDEAKNTLASLDATTYSKGFGTDLHPSVVDFLVRELIRDEAVIKIACSSETLQQETALHILDNWQGLTILESMAENTKLLERSAAVSDKLFSLLPEDHRLRRRIRSFEDSLLAGDGQLKVEGHLSFCGLSGLMRTARLSSRTGTVALDGRDASGQVYFKKGKVIGAKWGPVDGEIALRQMVAEKDLKFLLFRICDSWL
ncbi:DUF4388 domain-containing protein [Thermodesulfobacteriota bacterium]